MKTWLINPFTYIAGYTALAIGFLFMTVTLFVAFYSRTHFDGAIDAHIGLAAPFSIYVLEQLIAWGSMVLTCCVVALFIRRSAFRIIDIAGTIALSRAPMLLIAFMGFIPAFHHSKPGEISNIVLLFGLVMIIPVIWMITLMYNAFITSTNIKGTKATIAFITALILAEILSISLNILIIKPLLIKI